MQQPLYGLIGGKLGHSYSKIIHEQIADYTYDLLPLPTEAEARSFMQARAFTAINVTIPYKQFVIPYCDEVDPKAKAIGAVNTIVNRDGRLYGYNTDYAGFSYLAKAHGVDFADKTVLILGTGGTHSTVAAVCRDGGAREILTASRTGRDGALLYSEAMHRRDVQIIVNTTPCGMYPNVGQCLIDPKAFPRLEAESQSRMDLERVMNDAINLLDEIALPHVLEEIKSGSQVTVVCGGRTFKADCEVSERQRHALLAGGTLLYSAFYGFSAVGSPEFYRALFIGTIMTATSVSITVATLQELGHLKSFLGTTIVSAAVIDDVIGIIVLTCVLGASSGEGTGIGGVLIQTALFFLVAVGVGFIFHSIMKWLDARNPHTQRVTIVSLAFCFAMAYIAEKYFGIADITGAYIAGIVLCTLHDASYVERRVDISNYLIFAPIFFASIGLKTDISGLTPEILLFSICFVVVALLCKIIGCGLAAKLCRFNWGDSLKVGVGMMTRGEVALIVAQKGLEVGVVDPVYFTAVILLIVVSSVATPLALKAMFTKMPPVPHPSQAKA